jgi:hypothetical protein
MSMNCKDVDARDKPGHDDQGASGVPRMLRSALAVRR